MHSLISIHDVMPHTLTRVQELLARMSHLTPSSITLLVVPGKNWKDDQLDALHQLEKKGFELAGHGWHHTTKNIHGWYHRLHSALLSRTAAEHLSLSPEEINSLINDCFGWFEDKGFAPPDLYVPPAWAMGRISLESLQHSPFRYFENTAGLYDSDSGRQLNLPLIGFEADNPFRFCSLRLWNSINKNLASSKRPARLSIHPYDGELMLASSLTQYLQAIDTAVHYRSVF